jgi:hypothetical protein
MRTILHLLSSQLNQAIKVVGKHHFFGSPRALGIKPFTDYQRRGFLPHINCLQS